MDLDEAAIRAGVRLETFDTLGSTNAEALARARPGEPGPPRAVGIGIGVNWAHHPEDALYPATDLASAGLAISPDDLFAALSDAMLRRIGQWRRGDGLAAIRADWLAHAGTLGSAIRVTV